MQYNKDDIERIACNMIARLSIHVDAVSGKPNLRKVVLMCGVDIISYDYIDVTQEPEYKD